MIENRRCTFIVDRQEIGLAMNFGKFPVLWMEIGNTKRGWEAGKVYEGCKARITSRTTSHGDLIYTGQLTMFNDEQKEDVAAFPWMWDRIHLSSWGACLKADFGYHDVIEDLENAQAPMLEPDQEVIVVFKDSPNERCYENGTRVQLLRYEQYAPEGDPTRRSIPRWFRFEGIASEVQQLRMEASAHNLRRRLLRDHDERDHGPAASG